MTLSIGNYGPLYAGEVEPAVRVAAVHIDGFRGPAKYDYPPDSEARVLGPMFEQTKLLPRGERCR